MRHDVSGNPGTRALFFLGFRRTPEASLRFSHFELPFCGRKLLCVRCSQLQTT